jgi:ABC-type polysaccharide/polyol phosphate transport system ATPase subunit
MSNETVIKITDLSKRYLLQKPIKQLDGSFTNELWAIKNLNLEIKKGEHVGLIGPNGSGKSTLLKILAGITKPTSGTAELNGRVASILDIGAGFHPELNGKENVFLNGQLLGFSKKEIKNKFEEIVSFSGIEKFINEPVKNYSSGMYLRLAFSIMANLDFDIYLLDEVMNVGDEEFRIKTKTIFEKDKTILLISHHMNEISDLTEYFVHMKNGTLTNNHGSSDSLINITPDEQKIPFTGGNLEIVRSIVGNTLKFKLNTTLQQLDPNNKNWVVHLHNKYGHTLMTCVGFEYPDAIQVTNSHSFSQNFYIDAKQFKSDIYELTFYLCEKEVNLNTGIKNSYYFELINPKPQHKYMFGNIIYTSNGS